MKAEMVSAEGGGCEREMVSAERLQNVSVSSNRRVWVAAQAAGTGVLFVALISLVLHPASEGRTLSRREMLADPRFVGTQDLPFKYFRPSCRDEYSDCLYISLPLMLLQRGLQALPCRCHGACACNGAVAAQHAAKIKISDVAPSGNKKNLSTQYPGAD